MELVDFEQIGGYFMVPGMLCWLTWKDGRKQQKCLARVLAIHNPSPGNKGKVRYEIQHADGSTQTVSESFVIPLYVDPITLPDSQYKVPAFANEVERTIGQAKFWVGCDILVPEAQFVSPELKEVLFGSLVAFTQSALLVGFQAHPTVATAKAILLRLEPEEAEVVTKKIPIGMQYLTVSVAGPQQHDIYNPKWENPED